MSDPLLLPAETPLPSEGSPHVPTHVPHVPQTLWRRPSSPLLPVSLHPLPVFIFQGHWTPLWLNPVSPLCLPGCHFHLLFFPLHTQHWSGHIPPPPPRAWNSTALTTEVPLGRRPGWGPSLNHRDHSEVAELHPNACADPAHHPQRTGCLKGCFFLPTMTCSRLISLLLTWLQMGSSDSAEVLWDHAGPKGPGVNPGLLPMFLTSLASGLPGVCLSASLPFFSPAF